MAGCEHSCQAADELALLSCAAWLIDYGKRYHADRPISTSGAESVLDYVIGQRMTKKSHMRWSRDGANALLHVRCVVLHGPDVRHFKRCYPPDRRLADLPELRAA